MLKIQYFFIIVISLMLSNCSVFYYGYTKEEWENLSASTQAEVQESYKRAMEAKKQLQNEKSIDARNEAFEDYANKKENE